MRRVLADYWRFCSPKYIPRSAVRNLLAESRLLQPPFNQHTNPWFAAPLIAGCRTMATGDSSASPDIKQQRKNRLVNEKSPYLLQHASNPVDWWAAKHGMHSYEGWLEKWSDINIICNAAIPLLPPSHCWLEQNPQPSNCFLNRNSNVIFKEEVSRITAHWQVLFLAESFGSHSCQSLIYTLWECVEF